MTSTTTACRDCSKEVSLTALTCPHCGAPKPHEQEFTGWGYEWKSKTTLLGLPLVHISFKYRPNRMPIVAKGWLAIGQFSYGFINLSQFGVGPFCLSQFSLAAWAVSQITLSVYGICQVGVVYEGVGQVVWQLSKLL